MCGENGTLEGRGEEGRVHPIERRAVGSARAAAKGAAAAAAAAAAAEGRAWAAAQPTTAG